MVLKNSIGVEFDQPFKLLANSDSDSKITRASTFAKLVEKTGKNLSEQLFEKAKQKALK